MKRGLLSLLAVGALACTSPGNVVDASTDAPSGPPPPLPTCVIGLWLDAQHSCAAKGTPESNQPDCVEANALVLANSGASMDLILDWSATTSTFSAFGGVGGVLDGIWQLIDADASSPQLLETFTSTNTTFETGVTCTQTQLVRPANDAGQIGTTYNRADPRLTNGVLAAPGTQWTSDPY